MSPLHPPTVASIAALRDALRDALRGEHGTERVVRFVPTMGALHEGHATLIRRARADGGVVLLSIFVNPTQFGPTEDLAKYPRTPDADLALAAAAGADLVWMPEVATLYPQDEQTRVQVGSLADVLCGAVRPGHFTGVSTVVAKLLIATGADVLYLGEKDFQQTAVLRRVVTDLLLPTSIIVVPTVRESDGLALSSRNRYLDPAGRAAAAVIPRALDAAAATARAGESTSSLLARARRVLNAESGFRTQYLEVRDERTLGEMPVIEAHARLFIAGFVGTTRLIDNRALLR